MPTLVVTPIADGVVRRILLHGIGEFPYEPHQVVDLFRCPGLENGPPNPVPCHVDGIGHGLALRGYDGLAHAAIGGE